MLRVRMIDVLPTFDAHQTRLSTVLSDNGREFCGRPDVTPTSCSSNSRKSGTAPPKSADFTTHDFRRS